MRLRLVLSALAAALLMSLLRVAADPAVAVTAEPIDRTGGARAWIGFREEVPHEATTLANAFRESVALRGNLGHSELDDRIEKAHFAVWERQDLVEHVSSHYDLATGRITIAVEPKVSLGIRSETERVQFRDAVRASLPDEADGWEVTIVPVDRLTSGEDTVYGGKPLSTCTSGFTVTKGSERGITTAAHCGDTQKYGSLSLTFKAAHRGTWGDVQWHTSSDYEADDSTRRQTVGETSPQGVPSRQNTNLCV